MDTWLILSFAAASAWALVNLLDKILVIDKIPSQWGRLILDSLVGLVTCVAFAIFGLVASASLETILICLLAGVLLYGFNYAYYRALETADVTVTSALMQTIPIFSAFWGFLFFDEIFGFPIYLGVFLAVLGAVFVNIEADSQDNRTIFRGKNFKALIRFILPGILIISFNYVLQKYALQFTDNWTVFFWGRIGAFILTGTVYIFSRRIQREFNQIIKSVEFRTLGMVSGVEWLNLLGIFLIISAYSEGPITLVSTAAAIQPIIVIALTMIYSLLKKESMLSDFSNNKTVLFFRVSAILLVIIGIYFISL